MGFVDIVGVSTGYIQEDFNLSDSMAQFIPSLVFICFFVLMLGIRMLTDLYHWLSYYIFRTLE